MAPLLFIGTAMFFERPVVRWWAVVGATALTLTALLAAYQYKMDVRVYSDAPGFSLLQAANRAYAWTPERARHVLVGMLVLSLVVIALPRVLTRGVRPMLAVAAVVVLGWSLAGQMSAASASNTFSEELSSDIARPFDWVDRTTGGAPTLYLGQRLTDFNGLWQMEFWNRSIKHIWSTDGSAPGPGPTLTPDLVNAQTGAITPPPTNVEYVVTDRRTLVFTIARGAVPIAVRSIAITRDALDARVTKFRTSLESRDLGFAAEARALYDLLLGPAAAAMKGRTAVVIVPDGSLWDLPFQALPSLPATRVL